jgi:L-2-hydroxyglutarate oxidase LhgO
MTDHIQTIVIGAGVVGLAVARQLALSGHEVLILEREKIIGSGISARNSEVIHAGLYYPKNSLKAEHCVKGRALLYDFCRSHNVSHKQCGKLIVATDESQARELEALLESGTANGVEGLELIDQKALHDKEPALSGHAALWCPVSGIIDSHALMLALQGDLEKAGGIIAFQTAVKEIHYDGSEFMVRTEQGADLRATNIVNSAGLSAPSVAHAIDTLDKTFIPQSYLAKGNYFTLGRKSPFTHLVYPLPEPGGLGVHLTLDLAGQARFGPDVEWIEEEDYVVRPERAQAFYAAIRRYWPDLKEGDLQPGYAGIRPKITPRGAPNADFVIQDERTHGLKGLLNLFGIESPGLTSSLSLAMAVENRLQK